MTTDVTCRTPCRMGLWMVVADSSLLSCGRCPWGGICRVGSNPPGGSGLWP